MEGDEDKTRRKGWRKGGEGREARREVQRREETEKAFPMMPLMISVPAACSFALGCTTVPSHPQRGVRRDERRPEAAAETPSEGEKELVGRK